MFKIRQIVESIIFIAILAILECMYLYEHFSVKYFKILCQICFAINGYIGMVIYVLRTRNKGDKE